MAVISTGVVNGAGRKTVTIYEPVGVDAAHAGRADGEGFIDSLMSRLSLEEKIGQLNLPVGGDVVSGTARSAGIDSLILAGRIGGFFNVKGVEAISRFQRLAVERGPHGIPLLVGADVVHGYATVFPIPLALSCSWDSVEVARMARISAIEATADGVNWNYSPMVDICRDPRWGRIAESSGEDPWLGSVLAKAYVQGYQGDGIRSDSSLMACVKHFALYGAAEGGRDYNGVDMSRERMDNYYLPPYRAAVDAGVGSVMTSFNLINGQHATACDWLIDGILRKDWNFDGFVVTDYGSIDEMSSMGVANENEAAALALRAGTDMDMVTGRFLADLKGAVDGGLVSMAMIDQACRRVLEAKQRLGLFDNPYKYCNTERPSRELYTPEHRAVARDIAAKTFVLLKNDNNLLPLKPKGCIALIGPLADAGNNMAGCWSGYCRPERHKSLLTAFREAVGNDARIVYAQGSNIFYDEAMQADCDWGRRIPRVDDRKAHAEALRVAAEADVIVMALGESCEMSGESSSRADITIPDTQRDLLKELAATGKPIVLLLFTGRPLILDWEAENIQSIMNVWFGGSEAADAIADVVFGDKSPCGRLTVTFPRSVGQIPLYYNHLPSSHPDFDSSRFNPYRSNYIDVANDPLYPFGFGLGYTTFGYSTPTLSSDVLTPGGKLKLSVDVTNTGMRDGTEIVQMYINDPVARIARPVKELKAFRKVDIPAGKTATVEFDITPDMLKYYDSEHHYGYDPGEFKIMVGSNSENLQTLTLILKD